MTIVMKSGEYTLQEALFTCLYSDSELMDKITDVYDTTPSDAVFPYVVIGETTSVPWDTMDFYGEEITCTFHVWSQQPSKMETKEIVSLAMQALSKEPLSLGSGFCMEIVRPDMNQVFDDDLERNIKHGVVRFRFKISQ